MKLEQAQRLANHLVDYMRPVCERIEIAGSIRRKSPQVKDIEIVAIPTYGDRLREGSLFRETETTNLLFEHLRGGEFIRWIKPGVSDIVPWPIKPFGKYWRGLIQRGSFGAPADVKLDLFLARPENWGVIWTIRTGSEDFSRTLVTYARDKTPYRVDGGELRDAQGLVPCSEEAYLFSALGLEWIEPRLRRSERDLLIQ